MHFAPRHAIISALVIASSLAGVGVAVAADTATPSVTPIAVLHAGDMAPGHAPVRHAEAARRRAVLITGRLLGHDAMGGRRRLPQRRGVPSGKAQLSVDVLAI